MAAKNKQDDGGVVAGRHPVRELLERDPRRVEKVMLQQGVDGEGIGEIRKYADAEDIPLQYVPKGRLDVESKGANHQGVVAFAAPIQYLSTHELFTKVGATWDEVQERKPVVLIIDRVTDPHNFGAMLRSAAAAGLDGIIVPDTHMAPVTAVTVKASAGTAGQVPIARTPNLPQVLTEMKERGYWVVGTGDEAEASVWDADWDRALGIVIGSEGEGMRPAVRDRCDSIVGIPLRGDIDSLNASVAAGIVLFTAVRNRSEAKG